jgi:hypothetical protein
MPTAAMPVLSASDPWLGFPGLAWDVTKEAKFETAYKRTMSGRDVAVARWAEPHFAFRFVFSVIRDQMDLARNVAKSAPYNEFDTLLGFFLQQYGQGVPFFITDPSDKTVTNQTIYASTPAAVTDFQMVRTLGGVTFPVGGVNTGASITVNIDGTPTTAYTANTPYDGWIRFNSAPGAGHAITASFSYYYKVRFAKDALAFHTSYLDLWEAREVQMETWR